MSGYDTRTSVNDSQPISRVDSSVVYQKLGYRGERASNERLSASSGVREGRSIHKRTA